MSLKVRLPEQQVKANLGEVEKPYTEQEARVEANRCLYCFDAPCIMACPTGIDVPGFIKKIAHDQLTGAARTILEANVLGASCARVCPTSVLCEGACVLNDRDQLPIKIGRLQRHAVDHVLESGLQVLHSPGKILGKRVALIGSGPASLGCAAELARLGYEAVIYEKSDQPGGLNTYGIAYYKMTPEVALKEVELVRQLGVTFKAGIEVGKDISFEELLAEYDAVFLGIGLGRTSRLGITGEDLPEVVDALDFIRALRTKPPSQVPVGRQVVVIGAGNTAIDAVTQAKRLGAESATIIYRRSELEMPAYGYEYKLARQDGCGFFFNAAPVAVEGDEQVTGIRLVRTGTTAAAPIQFIEGSEFSVPCDMIIKALGQEKQTALLQRLVPGLLLDKAGRIQVDAETGATNLPGLFSGGDAVSGGREVVNAVAEGKKAARGIHRMLFGQKVEGPVQSTRMGSLTPPIHSGFNHPIRVEEGSKAAFGAGPGPA